MFKYEEALTRVTQKTHNRFNRYYTVQHNDCWKWTGGIGSDGYGIFCLEHGVHIRASRFSLWAKTGLVNAGMLVCHTCDYAKCVNPDHLYYGTHANNMRDMVDRGRSARGAHQGVSKLTDAKVLEIREAYKRPSATYKSLAAQYDVTLATIGNIVKRRNWTHI